MISVHSHFFCCFINQQKPTVKDIFRAATMLLFYFLDSYFYKESCICFQICYYSAFQDLKFSLVSPSAQRFVLPPYCYL